MDLPKYCVLIAVYKNDVARHFLDSINSIVKQTPSPDQVVIVRDGVVPDSIQIILNDFKRNEPSLYRVIELTQGVGLSRALNIALDHCSFDIVVRQDADDISLADRVKKQLPIFAKNPNIALVSSWTEHYDIQMREKLTQRLLPENNKEIVLFSRHKTPFNHPSAVFRKSSVLDVGGYPDTNALFEDWWLALRLIKHGYHLFNLQESLVLVRGGQDWFSRRRGLDYAKSEIQNQIQMYMENLLTLPSVLFNVCVRVPVRLLPASTVKWVYLKLIRA